MLTFGIVQIFDVQSSMLQCLLFNAPMLNVQCSMSNAGIFDVQCYSMLYRRHERIDVYPYRANKKTLKNENESRMGITPWE
jgi:hypothetical protein